MNGNVRETLGSLLRSTALEVGRSRERKTCEDEPHILNSRLLRLKSSTLNLASTSKPRSDACRHIIIMAFSASSFANGLKGIVSHDG